MKKLFLVLLLALPSFALMNNMDTTQLHQIRITKPQGTIPGHARLDANGWLTSGTKDTADTVTSLLEWARIHGAPAIPGAYDSTGKVPDSISPRTIHLTGTPAATAASDSFAVLENGTICRRTKTQVLSDIGGGAAYDSAGVIKNFGTVNYGAFFSATNHGLTNGPIQMDAGGTMVGIGVVPTSPFTVTDASAAFPTLSITNTSSIRRSSFSFINDAGIYFGAEMTGSTYSAGFNSAAFFYTGGAASQLGFCTNGDVTTGGATPMQFITGGYQNTPAIYMTAANPGYVGIGGPTSTNPPLSPLQIGFPYNVSEIVGSVPQLNIFGNAQSQTSQTMLRLYRKLANGIYWGGGVDFNVKAYAASTGSPNYYPQTELDICLKSAALWAQTADVTVLTLKADGTVTIPALSTNGVLKVTGGTGLIGSSTNMDSGSVTVGCIPVAVTNTHTLTTSHVYDTNGVLSATLDTVKVPCIKVDSVQFTGGDYVYKNGFVKLGDSLWMPNKGIQAPSVTASNINATTYFHARNAASDWLFGAYAGGAGVLHNAFLIWNTNNSSYFSVDTLGGMHINNCTSIAANFSGSNLLEITNANTTYGSLVVFPGGSVGDYGSGYAAWSGNNGNIAPAGMTGLMGASAGLFLSTYSAGNIYITPYATTVPAVIVRPDSILFNEPITSGVSGNLSLTGTNAVSIYYKTTLIASFGYGGTGINFPTYAPASGVDILGINTSGLLSHTTIAAGTVPMGSATTGLTASALTQSGTNLLATQTDGDGIVFDRSTTTDNQLSKISFKYGSSSYWAGKIEAVKRAGGGGDLLFYSTVNVGGSGTEPNVATMTLTKTGMVGIGGNPGNKLTIAGDLGFSTVQTVTMAGDDNTTAPTSTNIEVKGAYIWTPAAGSLPDNTVVFVCNIDGSSPSVATWYQNALAIHNCGFWMVRKSSHWYRLTP